MTRLVLRLLLWSAALLAVGGLLTGAYFVHDRMSAERAAESAGERAPPRPPEKRLVKLGESLARSLGIEVEPARAAQWYETTAVYGRVVPNARATFEVRSPFPGTLRAGEAP